MAAQTLMAVTHVAAHPDIIELAKGTVFRE